ncbi:conserved hypothetical protein [Methanocella paludicola SANAE]|uniref:DUF155 domain-containing protein n=1 Tax=Methanocella paludicola (strain DSM 17711 / JCM 13418 / NBRC 101707 / SANAE) TaxID=304371 RepID=D1YVH2_METPS|nr:hypothetical protein [Methanocella paludicola]BAI60444.1 conserved hypothetical protein [Methanocella paludicola SANAE]
MINLAQTNESLAIDKGKLIFFVVFDTGGEVDKATLSGIFKVQAGPEYSKPVETTLGQMTGLIVSDNNKICKVLAQAEVFAMGVGIIRVEFELAEGMLVKEIITAMHSNGIFLDGLDLNAYVARKIGEIREQLKAYAKLKIYYTPTRKYSMLRLDQYTPPVDQGELKVQYGAELTRFLSGESSARRLHGKEIADKLSHDISYYDEDLFLVSYEAAFVKGCDDYFNDLRHYLELGLALAFLYQIYDWKMDAEIGEAFKAIRNYQTQSTIGQLFSQSTKRLEKALLKVSEIKLDILDNLEDLMNPLKVTSDWYYQGAYEHIIRLIKVREYESIVTQKIDALEDLYSTAQELSYSKIALITEVVVILLIAFEVIAFLPH